jgi:simple sugar transport system substrate-binding protein
MIRLEKIIPLLLLPAILLCGCSVPGNDRGENGTEKEAASGKEKGYITVGFSEVGSESDWRRAHTQSFKDAFTSENGYDLLFDDAQQKQENQLKAVRNFILQEVDYIILDPIVETGWDAVLQEAKDAGIPVILVDRFAEISDPELYTCWIGSDFEKEGLRAGEWLNHYLQDRGMDEEEIHIVTLQGTLGSTAQIGRTEGFDQILQQHENWVMLEQQSGDFVQAKGQEIMEYFLDTYDDIDVVISENDNMTFGAVDAIHAAGKTCGPKGDIVVISFDATSAALEFMQKGEIQADFECNPLLGSVASEVIQKLENGESVEKIQYIDELYFDFSMDLEKIISEREY